MVLRHAVLGNREILSGQALHGVPFLSVTTTVSITNWVPVVKVAGAVAAGRRVLADLLGTGGSGETKDARSSAAHRSEPQAQGGLHAAHRVGRRRQSELRAVHDRVPSCVGDMVQCIGGIDAQIEVEPVAHPESAPQGGIQAELGRAGNRVPAGIAPLARQRARCTSQDSRRASRRCNRAGWCR